MPTKPATYPKDALLESGPWAEIIARYVEHYGNVGCIRWGGDLVYLNKGIPTPIDHGYKVLNGIARKAAATLRQTCSSCGGKGKKWELGFKQEIRCVGCRGKGELDRQVYYLLQRLEIDQVEPLDGQPAVWFEHTFTEPLRSYLPEGCWRETHLPNGQKLRYLAREDLLVMTPWLKQVRVAMRAG
jgi:hypothetical protein